MCGRFAALLIKKLGLPGDLKEGTEDIKIRMIEVTLDNGTKEYHATNLFDEKITQSVFCELYFYR